MPFPVGVSGLGGAAILLVTAAWIVPSVLIARYAGRKGQSYLLFLLIGLLVSSFLSAILAFLAEDRTARPPAHLDRLDQLARLFELRDSGVLSADEFESEKARITAS